MSLFCTQKATPMKRSAWVVDKPIQPNVTVLEPEKKVEQDLGTDHKKIISIGNGNTVIAAVKQTEKCEPAKPVDKCCEKLELEVTQLKERFQKTTRDLLDQFSKLTEKPCIDLSSTEWNNEVTKLKHDLELQKLSVQELFAALKPLTSMGTLLETSKRRLDALESTILDTVHEIETLRSAKLTKDSSFCEDFTRKFCVGLVLFGGLVVSSPFVFQFVNQMFGAPQDDLMHSNHFMPSYT